MNELSDDDEDIQYIQVTSNDNTIKKESKYNPPTSQSTIIQHSIPMDQSQVNQQPIDLDLAFDMDFEEDSDEEFL